MDNRRLSHVIGGCVVAGSEGIGSSDAQYGQGSDRAGAPVTVPYTVESMSQHTVSPTDATHRDHQDARDARDAQDTIHTPQEPLGQVPSESSGSFLNSDRKLLVTVEEAARRLSLGRTLVYTLVMRKQIASLTVGRARRIPVAALDEFVTRELAHSYEGGTA